MTIESSNTYAHLLKEQGNYVVKVSGIEWYEYLGFMLPAYLPHCCPEISPQTAEEVVRVSGQLFARWESQFGQVDNSEWWWVLKKGPWAIEDIRNKKKRWMIRQGKKDFSVRPLTFDEVVAECPKVARLAAMRYGSRTEVETREILERRVAAASKVPDVLEYIGCFHKDTLVSFSENYIQNKAVWLAIIRHDPVFLNKYSSYGLMDGILDYYLNEKKMDYVLDGCRSIGHRTDIQGHLIRVFDFTKEYAILNISYSKGFGMSVKLAYAFKDIAWALSNRWTHHILDNVSTILKQEYIRRACEK